MVFRDWLGFLEWFGYFVGSVFFFEKCEWFGDRFAYRVVCESKDIVSLKYLVWFSLGMLVEGGGFRFGGLGSFF